MSDYKSFGGYGEGGGFSADGHDDNSSQRANIVKTTLTPVTIKQINDATQPIPDGDFKVGNVELNTVSFMGVIRKVDAQASAIILTIEDGTGSIEVRKWIDDNTTSSAQEAEKYENSLNSYVYVGGALKEFNSKKNIQNAYIYPITDHNEVLYHNLSAIQVHLKAQGLSSSKSNDLFVKDDDLTNSNSTTDSILKILKENSAVMQEGIPISYITQKLNISADVALKHCHELIEAGKIYTGYDDSSFLYMQF